MDLQMMILYLSCCDGLARLLEENNWKTLASHCSVKSFILVVTEMPHYITYIADTEASQM